MASCLRNSVLLYVGTVQLLPLASAVGAALGFILYLVYHKNLGGSPSQVLFTDKPLLSNSGLWGATNRLIIYVCIL